MKGEAMGVQTFSAPPFFPLLYVKLNQGLFSHDDEYRLNFLTKLDGTLQKRRVLVVLWNACISVTK